MSTKTFFFEWNTKASNTIITHQLKTHLKNYPYMGLHSNIVVEVSGGKKRGNINHSLTQAVSVTLCMEYVY